jgi:hypothetical protein
MELQKRIKTTLELVCVLYYGQSGMFEMILPLTNEAIHHFCRLFLWLPIGSICGPICSRRSNVGTWILGATVWRW